MGRTVYYDYSGNEVEPPKADTVKHTRADRIRSITDEELAEFIAYSTSCETCPARKGGSDECHNTTNCSTAWLDWLKEDVKDG